MKYDTTEPCKTCPYRSDVALGVWHRSEFERLARLDRTEYGTTYACHAGRHDAPEMRRLCIGWLIDQRERGLPSIALRLLLMSEARAVEVLTLASAPVPLLSMAEMCRRHGVATAQAPDWNPETTDDEVRA